MHNLRLLLALCVLALSSLAQAAAAKSTSLIFFSEPKFSGQTVQLDPAELANAQCGVFCFALSIGGTPRYQGCGNETELTKSP